MAIYSSDNVTNRTGVAVPVSAGGVCVAYAEVVCPAAPTTSDTLEFFTLPAGARILAATLESTDMDTGGAPSLTLNIGDAGSATRLFSASTVGQAGTAAVATAATGLFYKTAAPLLITGKAQANAQTGAAGTVSLSVLYMVD